MTKIRLRKWIEYTLIIINIICFMLLGSECDDLGIFILSKVILLGISLLTGYILMKYSRLMED